MIKTLAIEENPREKALRNGVASLSDIELLALCLRTGNKEQSVLELSLELLQSIGGIKAFKNVTYGKLIALKGIKQAKAIELLAIVELSKRMNAEIKQSLVMSTPRDVYHLVKDEMETFDQEHFMIIILDHKHRLLCKKNMFIGSVRNTVVSVREIFSEVLRNNGSAIVCVHNHPSGEATASEADFNTTEHLVSCGELLGIEVVDHIITGRHQYYSCMGHKLFLEDF
jgi:DNA repair protein RadC